MTSDQATDFDVFQGIDHLAGDSSKTGRHKKGRAAQNRRLNSEDDITTGGLNNESDISSEDFDNADDFNQQFNELETRNDRLHDLNEVPDDQLSEISSSVNSEH